MIVEFAIASIVSLARALWTTYRYHSHVCAPAPCSAHAKHLEHEQRLTLHLEWKRLPSYREVGELRMYATDKSGAPAFFHSALFSGDQYAEMIRIGECASHE